MEREPHHNLYRKTGYEIDPRGRQVPRIHEYTELGIGANYLDENGKWSPSQEQIELLPGQAVARQGPHHLSLGGQLEWAVADPVAVA